MMYPYLTLNDETEITYSEMKPDGRVKVYIETPDDHGGFRSATCYLPDYNWENISGYSALEMEYFKRLLQDNAHLIMEFSQEGGFHNVEEVEPDIEELDALKRYHDGDSDFQLSISHEELLKELGL